MKAKVKEVQVIDLLSKRNIINLIIFLIFYLNICLDYNIIFINIINIFGDWGLGIGDWGLGGGGLGPTPHTQNPNPQTPAPK